MIHLPQKHDVQVVCNFEAYLRDPSGGLVKDSVRKGHNIWTLTGREFLAELMSLFSVTTGWVPVRDDRIYYMGVGEGVQSEVESVSALADPVEYRSGEFLAPIQIPVTFPAAATSTPRTSVQFIREFASNEISVGADVIVTEAGLYTNGDPDNNNDPGRPTDFATAAGQAPVAYHQFEPITKFIGFTLVLLWEVRIV